MQEVLTQCKKMCKHDVLSCSKNLTHLLFKLKKKKSLRTRLYQIICTVGNVCVLLPHCSLHLLFLHNNVFQYLKYGLMHLKRANKYKMETDVQMLYGYRMQYSPSIRIKGTHIIRSSEKHLFKY